MRPRRAEGTVKGESGSSKGAGVMLEQRPHVLLGALVAAACVLVLAVSAAGAPPRATSVTLPAPVLRLAADATGVAVHTHATDGCDTILLWLPPARPTKVTVQNCQQPSTGAAITSLALYGKRPAWVAYAGGNYREFTVSTTLRGKPVFISFRTVPVENSASVRWRVAPGSGVLAFEQNGTLWRIVRAGGGACPYPQRLKMCARVPGSGTLLGVGGGRLLVRTGSGVSLLRQNGSTVATYADAPEAVTDGTRVVELANGRLISGGRSIAVPKAAHLAGTTHGLVALTAGGKTLVVRLRDGRTKSFGGFVAALADYGLYTAAGRRLTFTPLGALGP
jgi:hypothetical protein